MHTRLPKRFWVLAVCLIVLVPPAWTWAQNSAPDDRQDENIPFLDRLIEHGGPYPGTLVSNVLPSMFDRLGGQWERLFRKTWSTNIPCTLKVSRKVEKDWNGSPQLVYRLDFSWKPKSPDERPAGHVSWPLTSKDTFLHNPKRTFEGESYNSHVSVEKSFEMLIDEDGWPLAVTVMGLVEGKPIPWIDGNKPNLIRYACRFSFVNPRRANFDQVHKRPPNR